MNQDVASRVGIAPDEITTTDTVAVAEVVRSILSSDITEESAVRVALLNNRSAVAIYEQIGLSQAEVLQAGLLRNPVFSGNAKFFSGATEIEFGLSQPFLDIFLMPLRSRVAAYELAATEAMVKHSLVQLAFDSRRALIDLRASKDTVQLRAEVLRAAEASGDLMRRLHEAGNVTDRQLTVELAAAARARLNLAEAERVEREAREKINVLLGLWGGDIGWQVSGRLPEFAETPAWESIETRAISASLDLGATRAHVDAAAQRSGLVSWDFILPTAELGLAGKHETSGEWGFGPEVALSIPVFDFGQAARLGASTLLRQRLSEYYALAVEVRAAARLLRERSIAFAERAAYLRGVLLPLQSRLTRETLQQFNAMQIGAFEVMLVRQQEIDTAAQYIESLRDAWLSRLDAEELLAGSLNRARVDAMEAIVAGPQRSVQEEH